MEKKMNVAIGYVDNDDCFIVRETSNIPFASMKTLECASEAMELLRTAYFLVLEKMSVEDIQRSDWVRKTESLLKKQGLLGYPPPTL